MPLARVRLKIQRRVLAPLEPDAFMAWAYRNSPQARGPGTSPLTLEDVWFELSRRTPELTREELRRSYVRIAARVRRNQRLGIDPWGGV